MQNQNQAAESRSETEHPQIFREFWDARTARVLFTTLIFLLVLAFIHAARETLVLFLFSVLFAYFLEPLVAWFERKVRGRSKAIAIVYVGLVVILTGLGFLVGPKIASESRDLASTLPALLNRLSSGELLSTIGQKYHWGPQRVEQVQSFLSAHRDDIADYGKVLAAKLAAPAQRIWWLILIPILSLFLLKEGKTIAQNLVEFGRSREERNVLSGLLYDVNVMLGSYIRSQIILSCLTMVAYTLVLGVLRVPYTFILGPIAGVLEFIPVVGPAVGGVLIVLIAVLSGYNHGVWLVFFLGIWRLIQDYVSAPKIMGKSLEIDPLVQIFAVLAGGEAAGIVGALVSVPAVATLRIIWRRMKSAQNVSAV